MSESPARGWAAWLRTPVGMGVVALVVIGVFLAVRWRGGGEAGAAFGEQDRAAADCVAVHPDGLAEADFAFDGVVTGSRSVLVRGVQYREVSFEVREWFAGGEGEEVTVAMTSNPSEGARLLVAGGHDPEALLAWDACGFVRYFDPTLADTWRATL